MPSLALAGKGKGSAQVVQLPGGRILSDRFKVLQKICARDRPEIWPVFSQGNPKRYFQPTALLYQGY